MKKLFLLFAAASICSAASAAKGDVTNGWLMVEDFESYDVSDDVPIWNNRGGDITSLCYIVNNKTANQAAKINGAVTTVDVGKRTAYFEGGDGYGSVMELDVTLPEGKTLANYSDIKFNLLRDPSDADYKNMHIQANDFIILKQTNYPHQATPPYWYEKSYAIPTNTVGNTFKLRLGLETNSGKYYIDNVMLKETASTGISHVTENVLSVFGGDHCIIVNGNGKASIFSTEGKQVYTGEVNGCSKIDMKPGLYIVSVNGKISKVIVK